jgi:hypothetical protein
MITNKDLWITLNSNQRIEKISEALTQLKEIDTKDSKLKNNIGQGRLANVKKSLEEFVINAVGWESDNQLRRHF